MVPNMHMYKYKLLLLLSPSLSRSVYYNYVPEPTNSGVHMCHEDKGHDMNADIKRIAF